MSKDQQVTAIRIRSRAMRRAGELLKQIEPNEGKGRPEKNSTGADTIYSRKSAAEAAGMSKRQQVTAVRIANIPREDFERQVESSNPPTVTALAIQGTYGRKAPDPETWLASYARQAEDDELEKMAIRIRSRAMRRAGELAKQMMQPQGRPENKDEGALMFISKAKVQEVSGFSERQPRGRHRPAGFRWPELHALAF